MRQGMEMSLAETLHISNAHGSAIRGVWTDGTIVATTGIDQRLKIWRLAFAKGNGGGTGGRGEGEGEGKGEGDGGGGRLSCAHAFCTAVEAGETECLNVESLMNQITRASWGERLGVAGERKFRAKVRHATPAARARKQG